MENNPENVPVFGNILKMLFSYNFSDFLMHFLSFQTNFISKNFKIYTLTQPKMKIKILSKRKKEWDRREKEWQIEGKIDRSGRREIIVDGGRRRLDRVGLGVEWSGLVVSGGQIDDVEQEGEQDRCVENELGLGWVENKIDFGWWQSGWQHRWASSDDYDGDSLSLSLSLSLHFFGL